MRAARRARPVMYGGRVTRAERLEAFDAFMAARKQIVAHDQQGRWLPTNQEGERCLKWPLEIGGEQPEEAKLVLVGRPRYARQFRLLLLCGPCLARLDCTDEVHTNGGREPIDKLPALVEGHHYHPWKLNRRFFVKHGDGARPVKLSLAVPFDAATNLEGALRWFCADNNIESLPSDHHIELPPATSLFG